MPPNRIYRDGACTVSTKPKEEKSSHTTAFFSLYVSTFCEFCVRRISVAAVVAAWPAASEPLQGVS